MNSLVWFIAPRNTLCSYAVSGTSHPGAMDSLSLWPFSAVSRNGFRPGEPRNGPESHFFFKDPIFIWEKGNLGALSLPGASLLLGEIPKVVLPFGPPGARKTPEMARFGRAAGKIELTAASAPKFRSSDPLESSGLMKKRPRYGPFSPKISSIPQLSLELKASKEYVNERTDYFFKDGQQIRNLWTEDDNILLSDLPNIWFARKPEQVRHAEEKLQQISNSTLEQTVKSPVLTKKPADENTEKRKRDSPGLAGNRSKEPHIDMDVNDINTIDEEDEERTSDSESNTRDEIVTTVVIENKDVNNEILPKQKGGGKVKSKITKPSLPKPVTDFPPLPSKPNTQKKISALFTPAGRKPSGPDSGLPAPVIPT